MPPRSKMANPRPMSPKKARTTSRSVWAEVTASGVLFPKSRRALKALAVARHTVRRSFAVPLYGWHRGNILFLGLSGFAASLRPCPSGCCGQVKGPLNGERALLVYGGDVRLVRSSWLALRKRVPYSFSRESVRKLKGHVAGAPLRRAKRTRKLTPESASAMPKPV